MHFLLVKFHSGLTDSEVHKLLDQRLPSVLAVPGLLQKYYAREASTGDYVGVHVFDSEESLIRYRHSELSRSLPVAYATSEQPRVETFEVLFPLRPEMGSLTRSVEGLITSDKC
jgi:hypothetical protein